MPLWAVLTSLGCFADGGVRSGFDVSRLYGDVRSRWRQYYDKMVVNFILSSLGWLRQNSHLRPMIAFDSSGRGYISILLNRTCISATVGAGRGYCRFQDYALRISRICRFLTMCYGLVVKGVNKSSNAMAQERWRKWRLGVWHRKPSQLSVGRASGCHISPEHW